MLYEVALQYAIPPTLAPTSSLDYHIPDNIDQNWHATPSAYTKLRFFLINLRLDTSPSGGISRRTAGFSREPHPTP